MTGDIVIERQSNPRTRAYRWFWSVATNDIEAPDADRQEFPCAIASTARTWLGAQLAAHRQARRLAP